MFGKLLNSVTGRSDLTCAANSKPTGTIKSQLESGGKAAGLLLHALHSGHADTLGWQLARWRWLTMPALSLIRLPVNM